eukprot:2248691-Pleurochrysis_carterae.AAC.1
MPKQARTNTSVRSYCQAQAQAAQAAKEVMFGGSRCNTAPGDTALSAVQCGRAHSRGWMEPRQGHGISRVRSGAAQAPRRHTPLSAGTCCCSSAIAAVLVDVS